MEASRLETAKASRATADVLLFAIRAHGDGFDAIEAIEAIDAADSVALDVEDPRDIHALSKRRATCPSVAGVALSRGAHQETDAGSRFAGKCSRLVLPSGGTEQW